MSDKQDLEKVLSIIMHDARNLLANINVASQHLLVSEPEFNLNLNELAAVISRTSKRVEELISSASRLLLIRRSEYRPKMETGIITERILTIIADYDDLVKYRNLLVNFLNDSREVTMEIDWLCLEDALRKILQYSIRVSPSGETVTITLNKTKGFEVSIHNKSTVPAKNRSGFFTYTLDPETTAYETDAIIAKKMIDILGGEISLKTSQNNGTTICISLPEQQA